MTVKELIEKLNKLPQDFEVVIDTGDMNCLYANNVYEGSQWNVVITSDDETDD